MSIVKKEQNSDELFGDFLILLRTTHLAIYKPRCNLLMALMEFFNIYELLTLIGFFNIYSSGFIFFIFIKVLTLYFTNK